jgi:hypothetical protein
MSDAWERVWIDFYDETQTSGSMVGKVYATDLGDVEYIRADVSAARIADLTRQLAEARDKALDDAQLAAQQCLIDLAHSTGGDMERRASTLINAETHVSFAIRNLKGPTP